MCRPWPRCRPLPFCLFGPCPDQPRCPQCKVPTRGWSGRRWRQTLVGKWSGLSHRHRATGRILKIPPKLIKIVRMGSRTVHPYAGHPSIQFHSFTCKIKILYRYNLFPSNSYRHFGGAIRHNCGFWAKRHWRGGKRGTDGRGRGEKAPVLRTKTTEEACQTLRSPA